MSAAVENQVAESFPTANVSERCYANEGNRAVLDLLGSEPMLVLDVGCGSGDNAKLARQLGLEHEFYGITLSAGERDVAMHVMKECWVEDLESSKLQCLEGRKFNAILFSHVLEHLKNPASVIAKSLNVLQPDGVVVIAVPNVLVWRQRLKFLLGRFDYTQDGTMDETHLRFYTYDSADRYLIDSNPELKLEVKEVEGSVPLWFLRHHLLSNKMTARLDRLGCKVFPNLFGHQILIRARKVATGSR